MNGILVAKQGDAASQFQENDLDSRFAQYKYSQIQTFVRFMPDSPAGGPAPTLTISFPHGLTYLPAFTTSIKGYLGDWGVPFRGAQAAIIYDTWPYFATESVDSANYNLTISMNNTNTISGHFITIRVVMLYDTL